MISEHFLEAANSTSIDAPYGISEWALSGLTPAPCTNVQCSRVKEAVFAVEGKLMETKEFESRAESRKKTGVLAIIEGTRFWVREDAINDDKNLIDPAVGLDIITHHSSSWCPVANDPNALDSGAHEPSGRHHVRSNHGGHRDSPSAVGKGT